MMPTTKKSKHLYKGAILNLRIDTVDINGKERSREIIEHAPAVVILPVSDNGNIHLVQQYRHPCQNTLIECPAGIIDENENPLDAAKRELAEETGFTAEKWTPLFEGYATPGFCTEKFYFFLAQNLKSGPTNFDEDEDITPINWSETDFDLAISNGQIIDLKTISIYLMYQQQKAKN